MMANQKSEDRAWHVINDLFEHVRPDREAHAYAKQPW